MTSVLRSGTTPLVQRSFSVLRRIEQQIRSHFKKTTLIFRADSHHCRPEVLEFLDNKNMKFIIGPSTINSEPNVQALCDAANTVQYRPRKVRSFHETRYTAGTWSKYELACYNHSYNTDLRYVATNIEDISAKNLYEVLYCDRANVELMIKDSKIGLNSDRWLSYNAGKSIQNAAPRGISTYAFF